MHPQLERTLTLYSIAVTSIDSLLPNFLLLLEELLGTPFLYG